MSHEAGIFPGLSLLYELQDDHEKPSVLPLLFPKDLSKAITGMQFSLSSMLTFALFFLNHSWLPLLDSTLFLGMVNVYRGAKW